MKQANSVQLTFDEFGDAHHPPLIILHGFFASARNWRHIATQLAASYHVFVLNLRNHGTSAHARQMDYPLMAADVAAFMDQHGLTKAALLGHSMGGKVAMWFALNNPERIHRLIIVDIAPVSYPHSFDGMITSLMGLPLAAISNRKQADDYLAAAIPEQSFRQFLLQNLILNDGEYVWKINLDNFFRNSQAITAFPAHGQLQTYPHRVLFLTGSNSNYIVPDHVGAVNALFPGAIIKAIPDTGHWLHVQNPPLFLAAVIEFLG